MAKKETTDLSVEERLTTLYQLQMTLSAIDEKRALRGELPLEVQDLEDEIAGLDTRIEKIENEIKDFEAAVTMKKGEIAQAQAIVARYQQQLDEVKNNREYDTLTKEIEFCEKKIKEAATHINERKADLNHAHQTKEERQTALAEKKSELNEIMQETKEEEERLKEKAQELETKIDKRLLDGFKRIRKSARNGLGIVYVQRDACGGCFNKIPPQRQLDIKMHKKIIPCEYCGRIMIDPELAGIKTEAPVVEEKPKRKRAIRKTTTKKATDDFAVPEEEA